VAPSKAEFIVNDARLGRVVQILLAVILISGALYLARAVLEPIAFALFGIALVWPFQKAVAFAQCHGAQPHERPTLGAVRSTTRRR
jgi:hypothetical protein